MVKFSFDNTIAYLLGPVEFVSDAGIDWRDEATRRLKAYGVRTFNPLKKPSHLFGSDVNADPASYTKHIQSKDSSAGDALEALVDIRKYCLSLVSFCDWVVAYLPNKRTFGSIEELTRLVDMGKPVLFVCPDGVSGWIRSMYQGHGFDKKHRFDLPFLTSFDELYETLNAVEIGDIVVDPLCWIKHFYED